MDNTTLFIVIGSSLIFFALLGWKIHWFMKKINGDVLPEEDTK